MPVNFERIIGPMTYGTIVDFAQFILESIKDEDAIKIILERGDDTWLLELAEAIGDKVDE